MHRYSDRNEKRRDGLRDLLRSRGVQGLLGGVALLQVMLVAQGGERVDEDRRWEALKAEAQAPVKALPPVKVTQLELETPKPAAKVAAVDPAAERDAKALALAKKYERKGYRVSDALARSILDAALENQIDPEMAFGLVRAESGFKNSATSHVGAVGLTQLMPRTARWLEPGTTTRDLRNPEKNLKIGFRYLRDLIDKYDGDEELALLAYNRGPGTVDRVLKRGGNPNNGYVEKVMAE